MSTPAKTIVVFGATGYQGGSVVQYFLAQPNYNVRATTRNPENPKAQALSAAGAQVVRADLDDEASLKTALEGAHFVYLVTDFWSNPEPDARKEKEQAKRAIGLISQLPSLEHLIWSSLPSIRKASGGKYPHVMHHDGKSEIDAWIGEMYPDLWKKTTILWVGPYMQLWIQFRAVFAPQKRIVDGKEVWVQESNFDPNVKLPLADVTETGRVVIAILAKRKELGGKTISFVGNDSASVLQQLHIWGKAFGKEMEFKRIGDEEDRKKIEALGFPEFLVNDMTDTKKSITEFEGKIFHAGGVVLASDILPDGEKLRTWEEYVKTENWEEFLKG